MAHPLEALGLDTPSELLASLAPGSMWFRFLFGSTVLLYAIFLDLKDRRVGNALWVLTAVVGVGAAVWDIMSGDPPLTWFLWVPVVVIVAYLLWYFRLLFGGADAKCVMAFAVLVPYPPALMGDAGTIWPHLPAFLPTAVVMLMNAVTVMVVVPLVYFVVNALRGDFHPVAMFLGTRVRLDRVFTEPLWVMDWVRPSAPDADAADAEGASDAGDDATPAAEEGPSLDELDDDPVLDPDHLPVIAADELQGAEVRLHYMPTRAGDYVRNLARLRALGVERVWVTPKIPFMVPLLLGFLVAFIVGDLVMDFTFWAAGLL